MSAKSQPLIPDPEEAQRLKLAALGIQESDLEEHFVRSGGHGGQNVNKTSTCVVLVHRPTGIQVKCQTTRHQGQNRWMARERLIEKIQEQRAAAVKEAQQLTEKKRRQKRPRPYSVQQKILAQKSHRSALKASRRRLDKD